MNDNDIYAVIANQLAVLTFHIDILLISSSWHVILLFLAFAYLIYDLDLYTTRYFKVARGVRYMPPAGF